VGAGVNIPRHHGFSPEELARLPASEQEQAKQLLKALDDLRREDPLQFFQPHAKQHELLRVFAAIRAFLGGNRSGKTTVGIVDDLIQAIDRDAVPEHLREYKRWEPPFYCRIITPDFTATMEGVVFQKLREWAPRAQLVGNSWSKAYDKQNRILRFKNGSWFQFMTYEQDLDKFGGAALHRIHYDEEPPESIRKECLMRLIDYGGEELFTMTPLMGMTWMFDAIWEKYQKGLLVEGHVVVVDMDDNPYLDEKTKIRVLADLSHEERQARKEGRFVHFGGLIYNDFDKSVHVVPETPMPEGDDPSPWDGHTVYCGIDPGSRNMAAVVFCAFDPSGKMTVFDEIGMQRATVEQVAAEVKLRCAAWKVWPRMFIIDPAARNHLHQTGRSDQMEYADHGIFTVPGQNSVTAGINNVRQRLQHGALEISAGCTVLIDEFRKYRWKTARKVSEDDPQEAPVKKDDHLLDALRYVCMARPYAPPVPVPDSVLPLHERLVQDQLAWRKNKSVYAKIADGGPGRFL
jgi:phage terminase large subunit-like protein